MSNTILPSRTADPALNPRSRIVGVPNPRARLDSVVTLEGESDIIGADPVRIRLRYVPDKLIFDAASFGPYLALMTTPDQWLSLEAAAADILDDVNNEIVPRWVQVIVARQRDGSAPNSHSVMLEDRQPKWDNPALLARIDLY